MRRFTEILLLAAHIPLLLSFANGLKAMRSTVKHDALRRSGAIRGLLDTRQTLTCSPGEFVCERTFCCDRGWNCCSDGSCCDPNFYCVLASNGVIGCCPNGELCSGPAEDPSTVPPPPPQTSTIFSTSTSTNRLTTASTSTSTSSTSTPTTTVSIQTPSISSTPATLGGLGSLTQTPLAGTPTGPALSGSERAEPYRPLLAFAGILLALLYCA